MVNFEEGERVIKVVRRHWFVMLPLAVSILALALAPFGALKFLAAEASFFQRSDVLILNNFVKDWGKFVYSIWLLILWILFFAQWTDYYLDTLVITHKRIINMDQRGFFNREIISFNYSQIQDITVDTSGIIQTLLKFGTIHIQTAGTESDIIIRDAYNPEEARTLILQLETQNQQH